MIVRTIGTKITQSTARVLTRRPVAPVLSSYPTISRRYNHSRVHRSLASSASNGNMSSVTDLLRTCASQHRGLDGVVPLKSVLASLQTQTALTWTSEDFINLSVTLPRTSKLYDRTAVWEALAPLVTAVIPTLEAESLSKLMWSMQSLPPSCIGQQWTINLTNAINRAVQKSAADAWTEEQLAMAAYCVPALNCRSTQVKTLLKSLKAKLRTARVGDGTSAMFTALHLSQNVDMNVREVIDLYAALLEKYTTIQGTTPHHISKELFRSPSAIPTSKDEVQKQWSIVNAVDARIAMNALYASQGAELMQTNADDLRYVLYTGLGRKRDQALQSLPSEPRLTGTSQDVHTVLRRVYESIGQTSAPSTARSLGISLYGLQQLSTDVKHVRELLNVSARQLTDSTTDLYVQELQLALQGAQTSTGKLRKPVVSSRKPSNT